MNASARVLITSVGRRGQLVNWFRSIVSPRGQVIAADAAATAPAVYLADRWFLVPRVDAEDYLPTLLSLCRENQITLLVPTIDTELLLLATERDAFESQGTTVLISSNETVGMAADKAQTHHWMVDHGFPVPRQWLFKRGASLPSALPFPVFAKPRFGSRSVGTRVAHNWSGLPAIDSGNECVVEEYVTGEEFTVSTYIDRTGRCLATVPRQRVEVRDGEVSKSVTRHLPDVEDLVRNIAEALPGAWGPLNIQLIRDPLSCQMWVLEVNARFGGGDPLAWEAGANIPAWALAETLGFRPRIDQPWTADLAMLRYDDAVFLPWPS